MPLFISVGARDSKLSRAQVNEVAMLYPKLQFVPTFVKTKGDLDLSTSLRFLGKSDFFTKELDQMLLQSRVRVTIHSAKDLPDPLPEGISLVVLTKGVDPRDSIVFNELPLGARVATSSLRREAGIKAWRPDLKSVDVRGTIEERLAKLELGAFEGLVVAEAALIRLGLVNLSSSTAVSRLKREILPFEHAPLQGKLAILARSNDQEIHEYFISRT